MNGEIVCSSHSVTILSCTKSKPAVHNEKMSIRLTQEGTCSPICSLQSDTPSQVEGRTADPIGTTQRADFTEMESSYSQRSPCWSSEQPSPPQLHCTQLRPPPEPPRPLSNSLSYSPLHASNNHNNKGSALHSLQRRGVRAKVTGKKSTRTVTYAHPDY